jgi:hypothetical protein
MPASVDQDWCHHFFWEFAAVTGSKSPIALNFHLPVAEGRRRSAEHADFSFIAEVDFPLNLADPENKDCARGDFIRRFSRHSK